MRLIYVTDPIYSWRCGFGSQSADLYKQLADTLGAPAPVTATTGGLRPGQREPTAVDKRDEILHHWHAMAERNDMLFDQSPAVAMRCDDFVYDTEPACCAVVMAREYWAKDDERAFTFLRVIQRAFYSKGRSTTRAGMPRDVTLVNGVEAEHFDAVFDTDTLHDEARGDFRPSHRWGTTDFPGLPAEQDGTLYQVRRGYVPPVALYARAVEVLQQHPTPDAD